MDWLKALAWSALRPSIVGSVVEQPRVLHIAYVFTVLNRVQTHTVDCQVVYRLRMKFDGASFVISPSGLSEGQDAIVQV